RGIRFVRGMLFEPPRAGTIARISGRTICTAHTDDDALLEGLFGSQCHPQALGSVAQGDRRCFMALDTSQKALGLLDEHLAALKSAKLIRLRQPTCGGLQIDREATPTHVD